MEFETFPRHEQNRVRCPNRCAEEVDGFCLVDFGNYYPLLIYHNGVWKFRFIVTFETVQERNGRRFKCTRNWIQRLTSFGDK